MQFLKNTLRLLPNPYQQRPLYTYTNVMTCSRYEYVKNYELEDSILPNVWIVIRVDGKGFHKFCKVHDFEKPNDVNALNLMNCAGIAVMEEFRDIILGYGQSDEYSFVFRKETIIFNRRSSKLLSYVTSLFTSSYVWNWKQYFPTKELKYPPCFDGRVVLYPSDENLRDYLSWRQADAHINNLYNTAFWNLILQAGMSNKEAEEELRGTLAADKNELLYSRFRINYNNLPVMFRKGSTLLRKRLDVACGKKQQIILISEDMIGEQFWKTHSELLGKSLAGEHSLKENGTEPMQSVEKQLDKLQIQNTSENK